MQNTSNNQQSNQKPQFSTETPHTDFNNFNPQKAAEGDDNKHDILQQLHQIQQYAAAQIDVNSSAGAKASDSTSATNARSNPENAPAQSTDAALDPSQFPLGYQMPGNLATTFQQLQMLQQQMKETNGSGTSATIPTYQTGTSETGKGGTPQDAQTSQSNQNNAQNFDQFAGLVGNPLLYQGQQSAGQLPGLNGLLSGTPAAGSSTQGIDLQSQLSQQYNMLQALSQFQMPLMPNQNFNMLGSYGQGQLPNTGLNSSGFGMTSGMGPQGGTSLNSASSFHQPTEKNQIKLFVGGLAFSTIEQDLYDYFQKYGKVEKYVVMRDKQTQKGRGFGFVLLSFKSDEEAQDCSRQIIKENQSARGHWITNKRVDVKSADDYAGKGEGGDNQGGGDRGGRGGRGQRGGHSDRGGFHGGHQRGGYGQNNQNNLLVPGANGQIIQKPNPYVQVEADQLKQAESQDGVKFIYPKSKIFVGGLDFKMTKEELKEYFSQYGEVLDAIILKDINNGTSRGFGFVTFVEEQVAQELIKNTPVTEIHGRRVDIKKAEPKEKQTGGGDRGPPRHGYNNNNHGGDGGTQPAVIAPYGQQMGMGNGDRGDSGHHNMESGNGGHHRNPDFHGQGDHYGRGRPRSSPGGRGGYGGYQGDGERRGGYRMQGEDRNRGGFRGHQNSNYAGNNNYQQNYDGNNDRYFKNSHRHYQSKQGGSSDSHESDHDASYQQSYERAIRARKQGGGAAEDNTNNSGYHGRGNNNNTEYGRGHGSDRGFYNQNQNTSGNFQGGRRRAPSRSRSPSR